MTLRNCIDTKNAVEILIFQSSALTISRFPAFMTQRGGTIKSRFHVYALGMSNTQG